MNTRGRAATVPAFAKINLSLLVLHKRADGYHEIRTVFQTVSLADRLELSFEPGRGAARVILDSDPPIENNLAARAAERYLDAARAKGTVRMRLRKQIPMGAGMGGGSADAAAVLLALGPLTGRVLPEDRLHQIAAELGSDVPFFLVGGTAVGLGRGEELYPVQGLRKQPVLIAKLPVAVSTAEAYAALGRGVAELTSLAADRRMGRFRELVCALDERSSSRQWSPLSGNDFEAAVYPRSSSLPRLERLLRKSGAAPVRMTGSGSALFAVFATPDERNRAVRLLADRVPEAFVRPVRFLSRPEYRRAWWKALTGLAEPESWPPRPIRAEG